jgi:hypothetical protein
MHNILRRLLGASAQQPPAQPPSAETGLDVLRPPKIAPETFNAIEHAPLPEFPAFAVPHLEPLPSQFQSVGPSSYGRVLARNYDAMTTAIKSHLEQLREMSHAWVIDTLVDHVRHAHHTDASEGALGIHQNRFNLHGPWDKLLSRLSKSRDEQIQSVRKSIDNKCAPILEQCSSWTADPRRALEGGAWLAIESMRGLSRADPEVVLHFRLDELSYTPLYHSNSLTKVELTCVTGWRTHFTYLQHFASDAPSTFRSPASQTQTCNFASCERFGSLLPHVARDLDLLVAEKRVEANDRFKLALNTNSPQATSALAEILIHTDWKLGNDWRSVLIPESRVAESTTTARYGCSEALWSELRRLGMTQDGE